MKNVRLVHQNESIDYQKILFERPISRLHTKHIGLVVGKNVNLSKLNKIHRIITDFKYDQHIIADNAIKPLGIPAELFLSMLNKKSVTFQNTDIALDILDNCNYSIVGLGYDGSSKIHLFIEKIIESSNTTLILYPKCVELFKTTPDILATRERDILVCNFDSLNKMIKYLKISSGFNANPSVLNIASALTDISNRLKINIIYYHDNQAIFSEYLRPDIVGVINFDIKLIRQYMNELITIFICLLCDARGEDDDTIKRFLTAGYLLKIYINNYAEFKKQLS